MLSWILSLFTGGFFSSIFSTITSVTTALTNAKIAQINATSDVEKAQIQAQIEQLQAQQNVLIANANSGLGWIDEAMRLGFALPFIVYLNKAVLWDKVWGSWPNYSTDPISDVMIYVLYAILGYLFLTLLKK